MLRFASWKVASVFLMTLVAVLLLVPSLLAPTTRAAIERVSPSWLPMRTVTLGLDLQGGSHLLLEIDSNSVIKTQLDNLRDDIRRVLREQNLRITGGIGVQARGAQVRLADPADLAKALPPLQALSQPIGNAVLGGGGGNAFAITSTPDGLVQFALTDAGLNDKIRRAIEQSIEVLRRRIDALGTREPTIQRQGADRILIEVPGEQDPQKLIDILGQTAKLEFRLVAEPGASPGDVDQLLDQETGQPLSVEKRVMVQGEDLTDAQPGFDQRTSEPVVNFRFNIRGGQRFGQVTSENVGRPFAIVLDSKVISAPRILGPITGGSGQISGRFTVEQATNLSILLRAGALPAKITPVEQRTVGPGLGQDSINAGVRAALLGTALVVGFMLVTYGLFGVFANIALFLHVILIFAGLILTGSTLTLPGIAGIVLTIGMAVDSNVLIYERIREEAKAGRSIISALDAGFNRAFATIVDSNMTMMIAAVILYLVGSGPVRGFAISLGLGILTTIVTAVTMTRMMIALWYKYRRPARLPI